MIPLLAPLIGSLAGSMLPAAFGTSIAGALGASGAMGGLIASAAPKALGAGIGTLLAGGNTGDAAINALGFGAGGALLQQGLGSLGGGAAEASAEGPGMADRLTQAGKALQGMTPEQPLAPSVMQPPQGMPASGVQPAAMHTGSPESPGGLSGSVLGGPPPSIGQEAIAAGGSGPVVPTTLPQGGLGSLPGYMDPIQMAAAVSPQNPMAAQQLFQNRGMI